MKNSLPIAILLFGLLLWGIGCSKSGGPNADGEGSLQKVKAAKAVEQEITDYVDLVGRLAADEQVEIRSRVSGFLQKVHFDDGQLVDEGKLLFTIEPEEYEAIYKQSLAQVLVADSKLDMADKTFARSKKLLSSDAISQEEFEQNQAAVAEAQAMVTAAKADAERVKLDVDYTKITSPITGRVDRALLDVGNYVNGGLGGGTQLTTVIKDRPIKAIANVDENVRLRFMRRQREIAGEDFQETDKLAELQIPCYLKLQDESDFIHEGMLDYAEVQINRQTGTSQVRGIFANEDGLLKPGMFVRMRIPISSPYPVVLIPDTAIATDQSTKYVCVVDGNNEIQQRTVVTGAREGRMRVVTSGLQSGETVVIAGMQLVRPGTKVDTEIVEPEAMEPQTLETETLENEAIENEAATGEEPASESQDQ